MEEEEGSCFIEAFVTNRFYLQSSSLSLRDLNYVFFTWFSHLHLILQVTVSKSFCPVAGFTVNILLIDVCSSVCGDLQNEMLNEPG